MELDEPAEHRELRTLNGTASETSNKEDRVLTPETFSNEKQDKERREKSVSDLKPLSMSSDVNSNDFSSTSASRTGEDDVLEPISFSHEQQDKKWHQNSTSDFTTLSLLSSPEVNLNDCCPNFVSIPGEDAMLDPIPSSEDKVEADRNEMYDERMLQQTSIRGLEQQGIGLSMSPQQHHVGVAPSQQQPAVASPHSPPEFLASTTSKPQPMVSGHNDITGQPIEYVLEPTKNDVLLGWGVEANLHEGNELYWKLIKDNKQGYKDWPKTKKTQMSLSLLLKIQNKHNGRFLRFVQEMGKWEILSNSVARKIITKALRE